MKSTGVLAAISAAIVLCASAQAGCDKFPHENGKPIPLPTGEVLRIGLPMSFSMGLSGIDLNGRVAAQRSACSHGSFAANGASWELFGDGATAPQRWASSPENAGTIAFLAATPTAQMAYTMATQKAAPSTDGSFTLDGNAMMHVLAISSGSQYRIYRTYSDIPADDAMKKDMCLALTGQLPVQAVYEPATHKLTFPKQTEPLANTGCDGQ